MEHLDSVEEQSQADASNSQVETQDHDDSRSQVEPSPSQEEGDYSAEIKKVRSEAKNLRARLKDAEAKLAEYESANLSEIEKITQERDTFKSQYEGLIASLKTERIANAATQYAANAGAIEPAAVARLIREADVEWDDELRPTNIDDLVANVKRDMPRLFAAVVGNGNAGAKDEQQYEEVGPGLNRLRAAYAKPKR